MRVTNPRIPVAPSAKPSAEPKSTPPPAEAPSRPSAWKQLGDKFEDLAGKAKLVVGLAAEMWERQVAASLHVHNNPALPVPPDRGGLKLASFNVQMGGRKIDAVEANLRALDPDVACLQEVSPENAQRLAKNLGMNVAWFTDQKAILSRYPITDADAVGLPGALDDRLRAALEHKGTEPLESRSVLRATIRVGGKALDVLDTHLSLGDEVSNARQLTRIAELVQQREKLGHTVLLAGDFNDNFSLVRPGLADPKGTTATPTDTVSEFQERYPKSVVGNVTEPAVAEAARALLDRMGYYWDAPDRRVILEGRAMTLDEVRAALAQEPAGTPRHAALLKALDGTSHLTANKRFDNILASKDVRFASSTIDQTTRASDHQAIVAEIRWD